MRILTWPYWPRPPVWRMNLPSASARLADGLAIRHLRLADVGLHAELAHHAVHDDLQVQLAHAADDGLAAVGIGVDLEGRIFLRQLGERHAQLFLVGLGLGLDRHRDHRRREVDRFEHDRDASRRRWCRRWRRSSGPRRRRCRPRRISLISSRLLACIFSRRPMRSLRAAGAALQHGVAGLELPGVHADEGELADERVGHDLEGQRRERLVVGGLAGDRLVGMIGISAFHAAGFRAAMAGNPPPHRAAAARPCS